MSCLTELASGRLVILTRRRRISLVLIVLSIAKESGSGILRFAQNDGVTNWEEG